MTTGISTHTETTRRDLEWMRWLVLINLGLVVLQALSAGFLMSGSGPAVIIHARVALALALGAVMQAVAAVVLWRRDRVPAWVARAGVGLLVIVVLQISAGHTKRYWLHVPIGVGLFGGLIRQTIRLDTLRGATAVRS
jgi:heme A synthase